MDVGVKMIKIENVNVYGFESAIRGMRNPMNSWDKSDSYFCKKCVGTSVKSHDCPIDNTGEDTEKYYFNGCHIIGENDLKLMRSLFKGGTEHRKYLRMINVTMDITAPLYWWKEFDTYKVGTVANSCSTMHKIHAKEFELDDFSVDHMTPNITKNVFNIIIIALNEAREMFLETKEKKWWWQMIQLLPSSYNQRRTVQMSYEVAVNIIRQRKAHKLDEWHTLVYELLNLPYVKEIMEG